MLVFSHESNIRETTELYDFTRAASLIFSNPYVIFEFLSSSLIHL